jgi:hypothetical protein
MSREKIINRTVKIICHLPEQEAKEILDFENFFLKRFEVHEELKATKKIHSKSNSFDYWREEEYL